MLADSLDAGGLCHNDDRVLASYTLHEGGHESGERAAGRGSLASRAYRALSGVLEVIKASEDSARQTTPWERHIQSILTAIVIGLLGWLGFSVTETNQSIAGIQQQLTDFNRRLERTELSVVDRYTASQADRDLLRIEASIERNSLRIRDMEQTIARQLGSKGDK